MQNSIWAHKSQNTGENKDGHGGSYWSLEQMVSPWRCRIDLWDQILRTNKPFIWKIKFANPCFCLPGRLLTYSQRKFGSPHWGTILRGRYPRKFVWANLFKGILNRVKEVLLRYRNGKRYGFNRRELLFWTKLVSGSETIGHQSKNPVFSTRPFPAKGSD